ncbi:aspartate ammonia-lyase [Paenibacillus sp. HN-1]|uniref:aspartate ammonia-lyase n=1 Tax=Paenibacillus TaxID=44249 RepID=UPI001CA8BAE8|nr:MULTISPECIES: aspartate ammonia-lyase [Paenibacillus]MBY9078129.1 aspartate ammonia-lyase [Paenibacillus sp. CGMCC 1.18879]MBY9083870.1 aspartate ammonia-lyase [Paenibacillus sinensis]
MIDVKYRVEHDFLGEKNIPGEAYYGIQALRSAENFPITGYKVQEELITALAMVKKAAALANMETGKLDSERGLAIVQASEEIISGKWHDHFIVDPIQGGAGTSMNMNMNEIIANRSLELLGHSKGNYKLLSPNTHVNMSQSTNDVFPTAIHLSVLKGIDRLLLTLQNMQAAFARKARQFDSIIKMGRTHLQDAVPIRLGQEFAAYGSVILRDIERIERTRSNLLEINMGATAVGTGLNASSTYIGKVTRFLTAISGYELTPARNLIDATQNTDAYTEVSAALKISMINMSKIANDLRLMASGPRAGLYEIQLPARQPGSSIMPGKVNPVMCEVVNQVAFQIIGNDHTISLASEAGQLELNVMEPVLVFNLLQSLKMMDRSLKSFTELCLNGITANEAKCLEYVEKSIGLITALNPHIGYETASMIARESLSSGKPVRDICLERGILSQEALNLILNPFEMTEPGIAGAALMHSSSDSVE